FEKLFKKNAAELIGLNIKRLQTYFKSIAIVEQAFQTQNSLETAYFSEPFNKWFFIKLYPSPNGVSVFVNDITEKKITEQKLIRSEKLYSSLFENAKDLIGIINEKGEVLEVNQSMETLFGYTKEEALKMTIKDFLFPYDTIKYPFDPSQIPEEKNLIINARFRKKDGSKVYAELNASRLPDGNYMGIIRDITERKKEEAVLKTTVMLSNAVLESIHNGILVVDQNGTVIKYNDTFADMWRIPGEIMDLKDDKTLLEFILDQLADPNEFISKVKELYADPEAESFDEIHFKDGRIFERISKPMHLENKTYGRVWSFLDITERRKAQDEYRTILATAIDGYYVVDMEGNLLDVNESYCKMIGYNRDELLAMNVKDLDAVETEDIIKDKIQYIMDTGPLSFETKHKRKDGKIVDIETNCNFLKDEKKRLFVFMKDVTQRNIAEEEIKKQKRIHEFIGKTNELILRAKTENDIYNEICRIAVETGNFVFAWLGIPDTKTKKIVPFSWAGHENGYLKDANISTEDIPTGRGPCGIAYREVRHYYCNDFENDPVMQPWRANAVARGYRSSISLPLMTENKVAGVLTMYAAKPDFFIAEELELLINLTDNINYALNAISNDKRRKKTEDELRRSTAELRELANHLTTIREEERSSIAKEIHDELSQNLVALNMNAAQLKSKIEDPLLQEIISQLLVLWY
ncbi:MAG: PAS domain S-box protein, partial [Bacteroidota bacterium]|nr:PAS domain S-box protein [Bacteroidota bacterium]